MSPAPTLAHGTGLETSWHEAGTARSQTRGSLTGSVDREGGGTASPTQGGGYPVTGRLGAAAGSSAL